MIAIREVQEVTSRSVTVHLPADFTATKVEVIVLPVETDDELVESTDSEDDIQAFRELLLSAPTLTDEELEEFTKVREWMNSWHVEEF